MQCHSSTPPPPLRHSGNAIISSISEFPFRERRDDNDVSNWSELKIVDSFAAHSNCVEIWSGSACSSRCSEHEQEQEQLAKRWIIRLSWRWPLAAEKRGERDKETREEIFSFIVFCLISTLELNLFPSSKQKRIAHSRVGIQRNGNWKERKLPKESVEQIRRTKSCERFANSVRHPHTHEVKWKVWIERSSWRSLRWQLLKVNRNETAKRLNESHGRAGRARPRQFIRQAKV